MMKKWLILVPIFLVSDVAILLVFNLNSAPAQAGVSVTAHISAICGNNIKEEGEQCDGTDLGVQTCVGLGYVGGTLGCYANCTFNTSGCTTGGGGGGAAPPTAVTKVVIQGKAYPLSSVTVLQDGKIITTTIADSQANFKVEITNITAGTWTFGIWAEDKEGRRSLTFSFTTSVTSGMTTTISGIFLPPTIEIDKTLVQKGETLNILGITAPQSEVSVFVSSPEIIEKTKAGTDGLWFHPFDTTPLEEGSHSTRAKATSPEGLLSTFSQTLAFSVGRELVTALCPKGDLNKDKKVNLVDFSILLYWWGRYHACADQNQDGIVNLRDFSIMLYWWTG